MREKILRAIREYWHEDTFPGVKMEVFIRDVIPIYSLMENLGFNNGEGTVAIIGESSKSWIAAYIAVLLKGCTLVVVPKDMRKSELDHYLLVTNVNLLITDNNHVNVIPKDQAFYKIPTLLGLYNAESFEWVWSRADVVNQTLAVSCLNNSNVMLNYKDIDDLFYNEYNNDVESVITPTSGTVHPSHRYVVSTASSIDALITKSIDLLPYDMGDTIYCGIDFSNSHFLTVLIPFIKGCVFTISQRNANIFIEDTKSMEEIWRQRVDSILEIRLLNWLFVKTPFKRWFKGLAVKRLKSYFGRGKKLKAILVYNWFGSERIISAIRDTLPLFTTYGSQECNQLIAYNDYSSKELMQPNCVGNFIRGFDYQVDPEINELLLSSKSMFLKYQGDQNWTDIVRSQLWYYTGDVAQITSDGILFIYGRTTNLFSDNTGFSVNLDNMERIIKNLPFITEASLCAYVKGHGTSFTLFIEPDLAFAESRKLNWKQLEETLLNAVKKIQRDLVGDYKITRVRLKSRPFSKTFDGKIERYIHQPMILGSLNDQD